MSDIWKKASITPWYEKSILETAFPVVPYELKDKDRVWDLFEDRVDLLFKQFHDGAIVTM